MSCKLKSIVVFLRILYIYIYIYMYIYIYIYIDMLSDDRIKRETLSSNLSLVPKFIVIASSI